jgi:hypothetical protein
MSVDVLTAVALVTESQNVLSLKQCNLNKQETLDVVTILLMVLRIGKTMTGL